jgi:methyltransferase-like protein 6
MADYNTVQCGVSGFWRRKYESSASTYWHKFYIRNGTNFYKDRHWLLEESSDGFPGLGSSSGLIVVEAGCGVANAAFPLLRANPSMRVYAFDFARSAIDIVRSSPEACTKRFSAFVWDFAREDLSNVPDNPSGSIPVPGRADYVLCLFVLSAIPPELQSSAVTRLGELLRPGGQLLFRDYCVSDLAASRFKPRSRIIDDYYVRQDGTLSYFFDENKLASVFEGTGLRCVETRRVERTVVNRKEGKEMNRVWIQAIYQSCANSFTEDQHGAASRPGDPLINENEEDETRSNEMEGSERGTRPTT